MPGITVTIIQSGMSPEQMITDIKGKLVKIQQGIIELGNQTVQNMQAIILANIKRSPATGRLANSIQMEIIPNGVGIGKITDLPQYWYVVNFGKYFNSDRPFIPGGGKYRPVMFADGVPDSQLRGVGSARATVIGRVREGKAISSPIRAMNFIEKTRNYLDSMWVPFITSRAK